MPRRKTNLGKIFADSLESGRNFGGGSGSRTADFEIGIRRATLTLLFFFITVFIILGVRLFYVGVMRGSYYRDLADNNRTAEQILPAPRGVIYDRNGQVLARNKPVYRDLSCQNSPENHCQFYTHDQALKIEAQGGKVALSLGREYPIASAAAHVVGYMSEVTPEDLQGQNYRVGDWKGVFGAEAVYETKLRGVPGKRLIEVDSQGKETAELARVEPQAGSNLHLAIDVRLQQAAEKAFFKRTLNKDGQKFREIENGAVVASDPKTGEILAIYSSPSFDPNLFVSGNSADTASIEKLLTDSSQPFLNRGIGGVYPPGSTFKVITAVAALESGAIDAATVIEDTGVIAVGNFSYANWYFTQYGRKESDVDIVKAIQRSNDIFFYKVGEKMGIENLENWAKKFSLGQTLNIDLEGEVGGLIRRDRDWFLGDTYHLAIGQGDLLTTPLQVNAWTAVIANGGKICQPTILKKGEENNCRSLKIHPETLKLIKEGMRRACAPGGTGWPLFTFTPAVACKTGTAEISQGETKTHAWMTAFAPVEMPEIAVTVLLEKGGEGSSDAGPVVKEILEAWFAKR